MEKSDSNNDEGLSFWDHMQELRSHLIRSTLAIVVFSVVAFVNKDFLFHNIILAPKEPFFFTNRVLCALSDWLSMPVLCINKEAVKIINIELAGQFTTHIMVSLICGIILAVPYIVWEFWRFIKPGLHKHERQNTKFAVLKTSALFFCGVLFSYFLIVPLALNFLGSYQVSELVENHISLKSFINTVTMLTLATGIVFELPVIIYFLSKIGIVTPQMLKKNRKIAYVIIIILSAIITPPDVFSQILISIPLILLYEFSIGISKKQYNKRNSESVV